MDSVKVQVIYTIIEKGYPSFTDAIYYDLLEYNNLTEEDINKEKQTRFIGFKNFIDNPTIPTPPSKEEILVQLVEQKINLESNLADINSAIVEATKVTEIIEVTKVP